MTDSREVLLTISQDMAADAKAFYGRPFSGAVVGEALGNIQAAVARIAEIVAEMQPQGEQHECLCVDCLPGGGR